MFLNKHSTLLQIPHIKNHSFIKSKVVMAGKLFYECLVFLCIFKIVMQFNIFLFPPNTEHILHGKHCTRFWDTDEQNIVTILQKIYGQLER